MHIVWNLKEMDNVKNIISDLECIPLIVAWCGSIFIRQGGVVHHSFDFFFVVIDVVNEVASYISGSSYETILPTQSVMV